MFIVRQKPARAYRQYLGVSGWIVGVIAFCCSNLTASAVFLRLGPFEVNDMVLKLEGIYTDNVEGKRPADYGGLESTDYYGVLSLNLAANAQLNRHLSVNLDLFNFGYERHVIRKDLDDISRGGPLGTIHLDTNVKKSHYELVLFANHESTYEEETAQFRPAALPKRTLRYVNEVGATLSWRTDRLSWNAGAKHSMERYADKDFEAGDNDSTELSFGTRYTFSQRFAALYDYKRNREVLIHVATNSIAKFSGWDESQDLGLETTLLERPKLAYTLGLHKETTQGVPIDWELTHKLSLAETWDYRVLKLTAAAQYTHAKEKGVNDVGFTYGFLVDHQVSSTIREQLSLTREPVSTFGSSAETDNTTVGYRFEKKDLFLYNMNLSLGVQYTRDEPMSPPGALIEKTWTYNVHVEQTRALSRKLQRTLAYDFSLEDSNVENELLKENRVTLTYAYTF